MQHNAWVNRPNIPTYANPNRRYTYRPSSAGYKQGLYKINLSFTNEGDRPTEDRLKELMHGRLQIVVTNIKQTEHGFTITLKETCDLDKLCENSNKFTEINLKLQTPPEFIARRTLLIRQLDDQIGKLPGNVFIDKIKTHARNTEHNLKLEKVVKFPNRTRTLLLICSDTASAEKLAEHGFYIDNYHIPSQHIHPEELSNLKPCYKCYSYEGHTTAQCTSVQVCSNCTNLHRHTDCPDPYTKKCINCKRANQAHEHHTLAHSCPIRKSIVIQLRQDRVARQTRPPPPHESVGYNATSLQPNAHPSTSQNHNTAPRQPLLPLPEGTAITSQHLAPNTIYDISVQAIKERVKEVLEPQIIKDFLSYILDAHVSDGCGQSNEGPANWERIVKEHMMEQYQYEPKISQSATAHELVKTHIQTLNSRSPPPTQQVDPSETSNDAALSIDNSNKSPSDTESPQVTENSPTPALPSLQNTPAHHTHHPGRTLDYNQVFEPSTPNDTTNTIKQSKRNLSPETPEDPSAADSKKQCFDSQC